MKDLRDRITALETDVKTQSSINVVIWVALVSLFVIVIVNEVTA